MTQEERRQYLITYLLKEQPQYGEIQIPPDSDGQKKLLRALMNVRMPDACPPDAPEANSRSHNASVSEAMEYDAPEKKASPPGTSTYDAAASDTQTVLGISREFLKIQDDYLRESLAERGVVNIADLSPIQKGIYLWQGDITRLAADAIVNAANSGMTGCYHPNHACIDNCIHTYAGIQLRSECHRLMGKKRILYGGNYEEPTGQAEITRGYNLPCKYVIHTVGPIVRGALTAKHQEQLASCYRSCLELAEQHGCKSIAFCCISTGVFCFPNEKAAEIAVHTVRTYRKETKSEMEVIFNVFKDDDYRIYQTLLA